MNVGDDVTINGKITYVSKFDGVIEVETKTKGILHVLPEDINTIRPKIEIPEKDERRGH